MKAMLEVRRLLRPWLEEVSAGDVLLVGCSGGADSLALAYALFHEARDLALSVIPIVIDHGLQENSDLVAQTVHERLSKIGYQKVEVIRATVDITDGLEASARRARFAIFADALERHNAKLLFLGHTQDDQAETVLLGLARGSGTKSLAGMAQRNGQFIRPMLSLTRSQSLQACLEAELEIWDDPHNHDPSYLRVRARRHVLPILEAELGPGIAAALARSAKILREDSEALDGWADMVFAELSQSDPAILPIATVAALPAAVRARVLRLAIYRAGAPSGSISADHLAPVEAMVSAWKGQGETSLPGGIKVTRKTNKLVISTDQRG
jgi:tRNA(Ile)-lysidine synthase